jgi:hypothetical protein
MAQEKIEEQNASMMGEQGPIENVEEQQQVTVEAADENEPKVIMPNQLKV